MKDSPTQRTLKFLRATGCTVAVTEKWNPHAKLRQDLFGFIDVLSMDPRRQGLLAVQATSGPNHAARLTKLLQLPAAKLWIETGNRIWVVSWRKAGEKGKRKLWTPRIEEVTIGMFEPLEASA